MKTLPPCDHDECGLNKCRHACGSDQRLVKRWLRVNYGLSRREKGKTLHAYGKLRCKGDWNSEETHRHIRLLILKRHAGWMITGYALISPNAEVYRADGSPKDQ